MLLKSEDRECDKQPTSKSEKHRKKTCVQGSEKSFSPIRSFQKSHYATDVEATPFSAHELVAGQHFTRGRYMCRRHGEIFQGNIVFIIDGLNSVYRIDRVHQKEEENTPFMKDISL